MSFSETIFLFVLALVVFGPKKLPEIARQIGKYMNEFKRASNEFKAQIEQEIAHLEVEKPAILPPSSSPEGTTSRALYPAPASEELATLAAGDQPALSQSDSSASSAGTASTAEDEPLFAAASAIDPPAAADRIPATSEVVASTSQESHV